MSKGERWQVALGIGTFFVTFVGALMAVLHEAEHHEGLWTTTLTISAALGLLALNGYSIYRNLHDANRVKRMAEQAERERKEQNEKLVKLIDDCQCAGGQASLLWHFENTARQIIEFLQSAWHHWDNSGEKLAHPVGAKLELKDFSLENSRALIDERRDLMLLYSHHLTWITSELPDFESAITKGGYPCESEYPKLLADLEQHANALRNLAEEVWESGKLLDN